MRAGHERYNVGARALHWTIAALIIANLLIGFFHDPFDEVVRLIPLHKSIGFTVLALSILRLLWRVGVQPPAFPREMAVWERRAAKSVHAAFYGLMIAMPVTGWLFSSAGKYPLNWFGMIDVPKFAVLKESAVYDLSRFGHEVLGFLFAALALLHIAAALRHHFVLKDTVLRRML